MSDFDKFFGERLNEEAEFPLRDKNWKALSQRLDMAGAGAVSTAVSVLKYWKAATVGLAILSGLLVWKIQTLQQVNSALQQEIERKLELEKTQIPVAGTNISPPPTSPHSPTLPTENTNLLQESTSNTRLSPALQHTNSRNPKLTPQNRNADSDKQPGEPTLGQPDMPAVPVAVTDLTAPPASETPTPAVASSLPEVGADAADAQPEVWAAVAPPLPPASPSALALPARKPELPPVADVPIIHPHREKAGRFRAGAQTTVAAPAPQQSGISNLFGAGATVEYSPLRNVWLSASADWLSYHVQRNKYLPPQFMRENQPHSPKPPGGGGPPPPPFHLLQVEGHQRMRMLNAGVRYVLPVRFWVRPAVQIAHTWLRAAPTIYKFDFEDKKPGPPPQQQKPPFSVPQSTKAKTISKVWRMGFALERETDNWVFRAGVDWVENGAASKPTFDALLMQGSVLYKF